MEDAITIEGVYAKVRNACTTAGGQSAWAESVGLSPAYVCDVLYARREPGPKLLAALGLRKVVVYRAVKE